MLLTEAAEVIETDMHLVLENRETLRLRLKDARKSGSSELCRATEDALQGHEDELARQCVRYLAVLDARRAL